MKLEEKKNSDTWTEEENNIVGFFNLLLKLDKKQNPNLYWAQNNDEKKS